MSCVGVSRGYLEGFIVVENRFSQCFILSVDCGGVVVLGGVHFDLLLSIRVISFWVMVMSSESLASLGAGA